MTLVEMQKKILADPSMDSLTYSSLLDEVKKSGTYIMEGTKLLEVTSNGVVVENTDGKHEINADVVVMAVGFRPRKSLYNALSDYAGEVYLLGNAKKVANISDAIWAAYEVGNGI